MSPLFLGVALLACMSAFAYAYHEGKQASDASWRAKLMQAYEDGRNTARSEREEFVKQQTERIASHQAELKEVERERDEARAAADKRDQDRVKAGKPVDVVPIDPEWLRKRDNPSRR